MTKSELEELVLKLREEVNRLIDIVDAWSSDGIDEDKIDYDPDTAADAANAVISFADWDDTHEGPEYWNDVYERLLDYAAGDE